MRRKPVSKVPDCYSGSKLIDYLASRFSYFSLEEWRNLILEGRVSVNDSPASADSRVGRNDSVAFEPPAIVEPDVDRSFSVRFEDECFLVVDKNGTLPCHPSGRYFENTLSRILHGRYPEARIATRLDRETSGLVLVCKSSRAARIAQESQFSGSVEKTYFAMVHGAFPPRIRARGFLVRDEASQVRKKRKFVVGPPSCEEMHFESCETLLEGISTINVEGGVIGLVRATPVTGRTHQIRATLCSLGFPLVGDKLYGLDDMVFIRFAAGNLDESDRAKLILSHQALHCARLVFPDAAGRSILIDSKPRWEVPFEWSGALAQVCVPEAQ